MSSMSTKPPSRDVLPNARLTEQLATVPAKPKALPEAIPTPAAPTSGTENDVPFLGGDDSPPRFEPWFGVSLLTFLPGSLIFVLPHAILTRALVPICVAMAFFFFAGLGMLIRDRNSRRAAAPER